MDRLGSCSNGAATPRFWPYKSIKASARRATLRPNGRNTMRKRSAGKLSAGYFEPVEPAQERDRDLVRVEEEVGHGHHLFAGDGLDLVHNLVHAEEVFKV